MDKTFCIGDFSFRLICAEGITPPPNFMAFEMPEAQPDYTYYIALTECLPLLQGEMVANRPGFAASCTNGFESRLLGFQSGFYYGHFQEISCTEAKVSFQREYVDLLQADPVFVSLLALERKILSRDGLVLHCAYLRHRGEAILFSAPSGTGKSTQAGLWEQYRGGKTINGDRCLLQKTLLGWMARGWPVCGSSEICQNVDTPVRAIVMLSQGRMNQIERLSPARAFSVLFSEVTINRWNPAAVNQAMKLIEFLVREIPFYHLSCTISEDAVTCLERMMDSYALKE